ncbi:uncharacterized protein LOC119736268 [Patiria miniata]|uniref:Uncharacterized protein n=1 Tax=Patiria miniata TaxID=46514 RepID=A0A914AQB1_PATMI|nr:uncharacterized protein LOC119736268 [Patiria miniata]
MHDTDNNIILTEFITLTASHALPRLQEAHLSFNFCKKPDTCSQYTITGTVFGTDGESAWAQYLCNKLPCDLSHRENIVIGNGRELPSNTVVTKGGLWEQMYADIVCWGGPMDPKTGTFIGHFQFSAYATMV